MARSLNAFRCHDALRPTSNAMDKESWKQREQEELGYIHSALLSKRTGKRVILLVDNL